MSIDNHFSAGILLVGRQQQKITVAILLHFHVPSHDINVFVACFLLLHKPAIILSWHDVLLDFEDDKVTIIEWGQCVRSGCHPSTINQIYCQKGRVTQVGHHNGRR